MRRGRAVSVLAALLLVLVLFGGLFTQWERIAAWWRHQTVKKLLDPAQRELVYARILQWQRYRGTPRYVVELIRPEERIEDVILCPQRTGKPFYVVVFKNSWEDGDHHFELVDFDGTLVPVFEGSNVDTCDFKDLNGDGVLDRLRSMECEFEGVSEKRWTSPASADAEVEMLTLVPMTPEQKLALRVVYRRRIGNARWVWKTVFDTSGGLPEIRLGPIDPVTNDLIPRAAYRWDPSRSEYVGPPGGIDQEFLRVDDDDEKFREFALHER